MSCAICLEDACKKTITCTGCPTQICQPCMRTYLLNLSVDPCCPKCPVAWTRPFLKEHLPKSFLTKEFAARRRDLLWEREKALLPEAQNELVKQRSLEPLIARRTELMSELNAVNQQIQELQQANTITAPATHKCPACKGYLDSAWHCDLGSHTICRDCYKEAGDGHVCDAADVATVKELVRDSKPCPKCGVFIGRDSGCDNMFCVHCKTAFNWRTMHIQEGGYIDNPHYFDYARENNLAIPRIDGPILPEYGIIRELICWESATVDRQSLGRTESKEYQMAYQIRHNLGNLRDVRQRLYNSHNRPPSTLDLRVQYLRNRISEEQLKQRLLTIERRQHRDRAVSEVIDQAIRTVSQLYIGFREDAEKAILNIIPDYQPAQNTIADRAFWISNPTQARLIHNIYKQEWNKRVQEISRIVEEANRSLEHVEVGYDCRVLKVELLN